MALPEALWDLLRSVCPIRTPEEERREQSEELPEITYNMLDSVFSKHVHRLLKASFKLCDETMNIGVRFVDSIDNDIKVVMIEQVTTTLEISRKWLDYRAIHKHYPCKVSSIHPDEPENFFYCDHIIESLYKFSIERLFGDSESPSTKEKWERM